MQVTEKLHDQCKASAGHQVKRNCMSSASAGQQITEKEKLHVQREESAGQQVTEKLHEQRAGHRELHEQCRASAGQQVALTPRLLPADLHLINSLSGLVLYLLEGNGVCFGEYVGVGVVIFGPIKSGLSTAFTFFKPDSSSNNNKNNTRARTRTHTHTNKKQNKTTTTTKQERERTHSKTCHPC